MLSAALLTSVAIQAQTPTVTATCKDGTSFTGTSRSVACRGHGGVQSWGTPTAPAAATTQAPPATTAAPAAAAPAPTKRQPTAASPGGAGQVWVNLNSKVYHCPGDKYYGNTKKGTYMTEADAKAKGYRADHGKSCT
jgi:hypothetical protein